MPSQFIVLAFKIIFFSFSCFLAWDPSLGAFYGPVALLVVLNLIFFMRISCIIRGSPNHLNSTDETEELPVNDIELTQNPDDINIETRSHRSDDSGVSTASSILDQERRPITQLRALVATMFLYIVMWVCGALSVAQPFKTIIPSQELIFSYLYGINSSILGIFMVIYYCLSRQDARLSWRRFFCCEQQNVYGMNVDVVSQMPHANGHVVHSTDHIEETNKPCSNGRPGNVKNSNNKKHAKKNQNLVPPTHSHTDGSVTESVPENVHGFFNPRQNGVAKKFWDKNRHHSRLMSRDINRELHSSGNFSNPENLSGSEKHRMSGHGNESDANTHFSIEIQIQASPHEKSKSPVPKYASSSQSSQLPPSYNEYAMYSVPTQVRNQISPVGGAASTDLDPDSVCCSSVSHSYSQDLPHHTRSPSSSSLGTRSHPSAFTPVSPRNNTLPKQNKPHNSTSPSSPSNYYLSQNGCVPRSRDFDGQSQVSENCSREKLRTPTKDSHNVTGYSLSPHHMISPHTKANGNVYKQYGPIDGHTSCETFGNVSYGRSRTSSGGFSSDSSNKCHHKKDNNFMQEVEERIPPNPAATTPSNRPTGIRPTSKSPVTSDVMSNSQNYSYKLIAPDSDSQLHYKRKRTTDSEHNSEPTSQSHRRKYRSHDGHRHSKHNSTKENWDKLFTNRPTVIPYAYVNHIYRDRVMQKLISRPENRKPESKTFWLPRSSSDFEQMSQKDSKRMVEDSSSSSEDNDDSLDNIWILQKKERDKKETSV